MQKYIAIFIEQLPHVLEQNHRIAHFVESFCGAMTRLSLFTFC